jgi:hypothetical protein
MLNMPKARIFAQNLTSSQSAILTAGSLFVAEKPDPDK